MECALTLDVHENEANRVLVPCVNMAFFGGVLKKSVHSKCVGVVCQEG